MTRTEQDLRDALHELERRADDHGAPSTADLLARADDGRDDNHGRHSETRSSRFPRWVAPAAAATVVAAAAITAAVHAGDSGSGRQVGGLPSGAPTVSNPVSPLAPSSVAPRSGSASPSASSTGSASTTANTSGTGGTAAAAASILDDAAGKLAATSWSPPASEDYFYVRTNLATTWASVSGAKAGRGRTSSGGTIFVPGCRQGHIVSSGESGSCTLNDVPHYRRDAPTDAAAWDAYLEAMAPGAKAADAQGKIILQVLHQDLLAPKAAAALLRFTSSCPGLHTLSVRPVSGQQLDGVTCASMSNGSYGLAFDATTREFVGFVGVDQSGVQDSTAEIVAKTGIVTSLGDTP